MKLFVKIAAATSIMAPMSGNLLAQTPTNLHVPAHERIVLDNGITLVVMPRREVPLIAFNAVLRGGTLADPASKPGVASLVAGLLEKGAGSRDAYAFADAVEGVGGSFGAAAGAEAITIGGQFLSRDRDLMIELLADSLQRPRFESAEFDKLRARQIESIKAAKDSDPSELIGTYGRAWLFGAHPYGRPIAGSEASLAAINHDDVVAYARANFGADRLAIAIAGDVDLAWARRAVTRAFGSWARARETLPPLAAPQKTTARRVLLVDSPGSVQSYFWLASLGVDKHFPQRASLDLVNTLYGGRFTSILNTELRIKSGLSYGARSGFVRGSVPGEFSIRSFTQTENTGKALDLALETLARLHKEGITQEMLDSSRSYVLGQYPLGLETASHWASAMAELELYRLGSDYIEGYFPALRSVKLEDARAIIDRAFPPVDQLVLVLIGDAAKIRSVAAKYGPVSEMPITQTSFAP
jgi:predicted Zn-dependent peptidase